ncbi:MAG TPA: AAA family ATPase [Pseudonocardiaceae bacterium]
MSTKGHAPTPQLPGREVELATMHTFLDSTRVNAAGAAALVLAGEPGIGKSVLWEIGVGEAAGTGATVLTMNAAQAESSWSFTGLTDLLDTVADELIPELPAPLGTALEVALLRRTPTDAEPARRAVSFAALSALRLLAKRGPLVIAIDDVQWLDPASAEVLAFALRRLTTEPVTLLLAHRTETPLAVRDLEESAPGNRPRLNSAEVIIGCLPDQRTTTLAVGPLAPSALSVLVAERLGVTLPVRAARRLHQQTGGNPLWVLEIVRTALASHNRDVLVGDRSILDFATASGTLTADVATRIATLPGPARLVLLVVAALAQPNPDLVRRAVRMLLADEAFQPLGAPGTDSPAALAAASVAGVVKTTANRVRPTHPLLGSVTLSLLRPEHRQVLHKRLAELVGDPEQRARHLAASVGTEPNATVADALDTGAAAARSRSAVWAAADLAELAVRLSPTSDGAAADRRAAVLAELLFAVGEVEQARQWAQRVLDNGESGLPRVRAGLLLASLVYWTEGSGPAVRYAQRALDDADDDLASQARAHTLIADLGDHPVKVCREHAERALAALDQLGPQAEPETRFLALTVLSGCELDERGQLPPDTFELLEAAQNSGARPAVLDRAGTYRGASLKNVDDIGGSRVALHAAIGEARAEGDEVALPNLFGHLALTEYWAGRYAIGMAAAEQGVRAAALVGVHPPSPYLARAALGVHTGDPEWARTHLPSRIAACERVSDRRGLIGYHAVLGAADLVDGRPGDAVRQLRTAYQIAEDLGFGLAGRRLRLDGDLGEALVAVGELDEAEELGHELYFAGERSLRPSLQALALRVRGLVAAARGNTSTAIDTLGHALDLHHKVDFPLERGRTLLALGNTLRRARARQKAEDVLRQAQSCFAEIGATPWRDLAAESLRRSDGARPDSVLTPTERRVAELVATGSSNREVAATLVVSVRTVEGHLAAIYRKLEVTGRTALTAKLAAA